MSSRAMRKLQGNLDLLPDGLMIDEDENTPTYPSSKKNKKKRGVSVPDNPFGLLDEDADFGPTDAMEEVNGDLNGEDEEDENAKPVPDVMNNTAQSKKKKKRKKKKPQDSAPIDSSKVSVEDEIDASIREVNALLGELPTGPANGSTQDPSAAWVRLQPLLTVEPKLLNPNNEMKKKFGSQVVQSEARARRSHRRVHHRSYVLVQPKDSWPHMTKTGLSMELEESRGGCQYFRFEHNQQYRQVQNQFWDAVDSLNPQNIVSVLHAHPHHIDSILQLSEVCRMSEDIQMATDLIERALFCFESSFHTLFNVVQGNCRLDYRRPENRAFYIALFRHLLFIGKKGCYRTALEFCKFLLSLEPEGDPLGVLLMIDFYALRCEEYNYLLRIYHDWEGDRNLTQLPNFAFSLPLSMFLQSYEKGEENLQADEMLQKSLLMFPGMLMPLLDKCGVNPDASVAKHPFFGPEAQSSQPAALRQLVALYAGRCHSCWKAPEVILWLEQNVKTTLARVDSKDPLVAACEEKRQVRYQGTPRNIQRHIMIAEVKDATAALPPDLANTPVMSYDPLPPTDSINSYTRPDRTRRVNQDSSALAMFFRSLLPNFNPQEVAEPQGAAGGNAPPADLRQGINHLMEAMRDLLNNIQPVPAPVENQDHAEAEGDPEPPGEWD